MDTTFDPVSQTVADDNGDRLSIWDIDSCVKCGGTLHRWYGTDDGMDRTFCLNTLGFEPTCDFPIVEREAVTL